MQIGLGLSITAQLRFGSSLSSYAVNDFDPSLVFDFEQNYYRTGGTETTLNPAVTHTRAGQATMTDGYGPELVTNGDFATDSGWVAGGDWVIGNDVASKTATTSNSNLTYTLPQDVYIGQTLEVTFEARDFTGPLSIYTGTSVANVSSNYNVTPNNGVNKHVFSVVGLAGPDNAIIFRLVSASTGTLDNISVKQIPAIKWAPHNLMAYSEDFSQWSSPATTTGGQLNSLTGLSNATLIETTGGVNKIQRAASTANPANTQYTYSVMAKAGTASWLLMFDNGYNGSGAWFDLGTGTLGTLQSEVISADITDLGDGWYQCSIAAQVNNTRSTNFVIEVVSQNDDSGAENGENLYIYGAHVYRSDLGGMVNNPETGDSYVPTTSSAVYLPRVGHHIYNGDVWVNEGVLHESEARTNMFPNSEDLSSWSVGNNTTATVSGNTARLQFSGGGESTNYIHYFIIDTAVREKTNTVSVQVRSYNGGSDQEFKIKSTHAGVLDYYSDTFIATSQWQDFSFSQAFGGGGSGLIGGVTNNGTDAADIEVRYFQAEFDASTPSSYIPTSGSTVTRAAETLTVPAANMPWPTPVEVTGTELVTNGDFATDVSGWSADVTYGGTLTHDTTLFVGGGLKITNTGAYSGAYQAITTIIGKTYVVSASFKKAGVTQTCHLEADTTTTFNSGRLSMSSDSTNDVGSLSVTFVATGTTTYIHMNGNSVSFLVHYWDNISIKEINPLSVSIQMDGRMTFVDDNSDNGQFFSWHLDNSNNIYSMLSTYGSRTGTFYWRQENSNVVDFSTGPDTSYSPDINVPFNFASRHGSTFINGAIDGTALTANTTPTALPDLSTTDLSLGTGFMGTIGKFRVWSDDLTDTGIATASAPSTEPSLQLTFDGSSTSSFTVLDWSE